MYVDSGATENVIGEGMVQSVDVEKGIAAKMGVEYEIADGSRIPNLGEQRLSAVSTEG